MLYTFYSILKAVVGRDDKVYRGTYEVSEGDPVAVFQQKASSALYMLAAFETSSDEYDAARATGFGLGTFEHTRQRYEALRGHWPPRPLDASAPLLTSAAAPGPRKPPRTVIVQEWLESHPVNTDAAMEAVRSLSKGA